MNKTIVISPSGHYYGSEQMLHEYLLHSDLFFKVFIPLNGTFIDILKSSITKHKLRIYKNIQLLYVRVFFNLLLLNYQTVYINEGGHIRYIKMLAFLFRKKKFVVHIRLVEDTKSKRLKNKLAKNIQLITVSHFIENEILKHNAGILKSQILTVYDYYIPGKINRPGLNQQQNVRVGVIGRVSKKKGIAKANTLLNHWEKTRKHLLECYFFGDVIEDEDVLAFKNNIQKFKFVKVYFKGFVKNKDDFFKNFDIVIHFNAFEPFPRIYFDAMSRLKPVVGFNSGGIGEQANIFGFNKNLVTLNKNWEKVMAKKIEEIHENYFQEQEAIYKKRALFKEKLNIDNYIKNIEKYF